MTAETKKMTLSEAIAISMGGNLPPHATPEHEAMLATLRAENANWNPYHNGGGCWAFRLDIKGGAYALLTSLEMDFATATEWLFGLYAPGDCEGMFMASSDEFHGDVVPLDQALARANALIDSTMPEALFAEVHDRASAEAWIEALVEAGLSFHFDDDPESICWDNGWEPSDDENGVLRAQVAAIRAVDWGPFEDEHGYVLAVEACRDTAGEVGEDTLGGELRAQIKDGTIPGYERLLKKGE